MDQRAVACVHGRQLSGTGVRGRGTEDLSVCSVQFSAPVFPAVSEEGDDRFHSFACGQPMNSRQTSQCPSISVVVLNYNGLAWLPRCFESLEAQTIYRDVEVIVVDNNSPDGSSRLATQWLQRTGRGRLVQNQTNLFFCE